jgi:hypothetical protein
VTDFDVTTTTLDVKHDGHEYTFRIPGPMDQVAIGVRKRDLARKSLKDNFVDLDGLDWPTHNLLRSLATFELLFVNSTASWMLSKGPAGKPIVDSTTFPPQATTLVLEVIQGFDSALDTFLSPGDKQQDASGGENLASQPNPE